MLQRVISSFFRNHIIQIHSSYKIKPKLQQHHHHLNIIIILTKKYNLCSLEPSNLNWICFTFACKYNSAAVYISHVMHTFCSIHVCPTVIVASYLLSNPDSRSHTSCIYIIPLIWSKIWSKRWLLKWNFLPFFPILFVSFEHGVCIVFIIVCEKVICAKIKPKISK